MKKLFASLLFVVGAAILNAQSFTGAIAGVVSDPSGAAIPGAKMTATEIASNLATVTESDAHGQYTFPALRPGTFRVEAEARGFRKLLESGIEVHVNDRLTVNLTMTLGALTESIEVTAAPPLVESQTGAIGNVVDSRQIENLPLNQRNPFQLALLSPGVTPSNAYGDQFNTAANFMINGNRGATSEMLIDGITNSVPAANPIVVVSLFPSPDALAEFKVQTNGYAAEFGRSGGGIVNMVIRSGTNQFHGTVYEFVRNAKFDANDFFSNRANRPLTSFKRNQYGFTVGGPVIRDKIFFFFNYESLHLRNRDQLNGNVPTARERVGDFSQSRQIVNGACTNVQIFDPATTRANPTGNGFIRDAFPNAVVPASRLDPVGAKVATFFPLPNVNGGTCNNNASFFSEKSNPTDNNEIDMKFDWAPSVRDRFTAGLGWRSAVNQPPNHFGNVANTSQISDHMPARSLRVEYNRTQTATLLAQLRFGITRFERYYGTPEEFTLTSLGFPSRLEAQMSKPSGFPVFSYTGYLGMGRASQFLDQRGTSYTWDANLTKVSGKHQIKFGTEYRINQSHEAVGTDTSGSYSFDRSFTQGPNPTSPALDRGNAIASLLLGVSSSGQVGVMPRVLTSNPYLALYIQDDYRVTGKLVLNLGLRWDVEKGRTERYQQLSYFDFDAISPIAQQVGIPNLRGGLKFVGVDGNPSRQFDTDWNNFAPRLSFAYAVNPKFAVRGGYGIFFLPYIGAASGWASGVNGFLSYTAQASSPDGLRPGDLLSNPFPKGLQQVSAPGTGLLTNLGQDFGASGRDGAVDRSARVAYSQQWNLNIQRQLPGQLTVEVAYVGNKGTKLTDGPLGPQLNQLTTDQLQLGSALLQSVPNPFQKYVQTGPLSQPTITRAQRYRPYPQFLNVYDFRPALGSSIYHAFQARVEKRFSKGLTLLMSFTGGKLLEDTSQTVGFLGAAPTHQNVYDRRADRSLASQDQSRRLVLSYVYPIPVGRGKTFGMHMSRPLDLLIGNWQVNGILTFSTWIPLSIVTAQNNSQSFSAAQRPNVNGKSPELSGDRSTTEKLARWFDTSVFSQPAAYTFGNGPRVLPDVRGDPTRQWDSSIFKSFAIREAMRLTFRLELFNATNTPNFSLPGLNFGNAQFGVVGAQRNIPRQVQFALKLHY